MLAWLRHLGRPNRVAWTVPPRELPASIDLPALVERERQVDLCDEAARHALAVGDRESMDRWLDQRLAIRPPRVEAAS